MPDSTEKTFNQYEYANRTIRAAKLCLVMLESEANPSAMTHTQWLLAAAAAGLITRDQAMNYSQADSEKAPIPSLATRARTIELTNEVRTKAAQLLGDIQSNQSDPSNNQKVGINDPRTTRPNSGRTKKVPIQTRPRN